MVESTIFVGAVLGTIVSLAKKQGCYEPDNDKEENNDEE